MSAGLSTRTTCRLCGKGNLDLVMELIPTPLANAFVPADRLDEVQGCYPLDLALCKACGHLQLRQVVDPEVLFRDYVYVSGTSPSFVDHFRRYADEVLAQVKPPPQALVVDIGSNDGTLLRFFQERGMRVLGIDPAHQIAREATAAGVETWEAFFTADLAREIRRRHGPAAIVTANNVFAHIDDLDSVVEGLCHLLTPEGVFVFEVSYLVDVVEKTLFDIIYHEHLSYHTVRPLISFFRRHGLELIDAQRVPTHGGSLRGTVQRMGGPGAVSPSVAALAALETHLGLERGEIFHAWAASIDGLKGRLGSVLREIKGQGKTVAGYGAPAKATTLLYQFGLNGVLDFIVDDSPLKQTLFTPGEHIPVLSPETIYERKPDYLLILAWNFAEPIMKAHRSFQEQGGHFVIPLPELEVR